jgi:hypothetical protein
VAFVVAALPVCPEELQRACGDAGPVVAVGTLQMDAGWTARVGRR